MPSKWLVQVYGYRCSTFWEISVVREDNEHGRKSWGWFDSRKFLVSQSGPCRTPLTGYVWDEQLRVADELCKKLNAGQLSCAVDG